LSSSPRRSKQVGCSPAIAKADVTPPMSPKMATACVLGPGCALLDWKHFQPVRTNGHFLSPNEISKARAANIEMD
jgi:hypothetical protein